MNKNVFAMDKNTVEEEVERLKALVSGGYPLFPDQFHLPDFSSCILLRADGKQHCKMIKNVHWSGPNYKYWQNCQRNAYG